MKTSPQWRSFWKSVQEQGLLNCASLWRKGKTGCFGGDSDFICPQTEIIAIARIKTTAIFLRSNNSLTRRSGSISRNFDRLDSGKRRGTPCYRVSGVVWRGPKQYIQCSEAAYICGKFGPWPCRGTELHLGAGMTIVFITGKREGNNLVAKEVYGIGAY
jgi:hypothetical protein